MVTAANDLLSLYGDNYDFLGFWVNFTPHHRVGTAFYKYIVNDVMGIGDPSTVGNPIFNLRPSLGLGGQNIEGFVMMWNINSSSWQPGSGTDAAFTRLALGQEYEHRFAMYLPDLLDGRTLQGDDASCGRIFHWSWKVDGQGSAMEISEWIGVNPAILQGSFVTFNTDIGGIFSFTDLYLMGYVTASEMDTGNSALRYMNNANCASEYFGPISDFSSADIIAAAGPRIPDASAEDKHYRTGWIMIHQPGDPPSLAELNKAAAILEQHMIDWNFSTLGRGTMNNTLFEDCNCNGVPDAEDIAGGDSQDNNNDGIPDECDCPRSDPPQPELLNSKVNVKKRYISILAGDAARIQGLRVRFIDLPPPFDVWNFVNTGQNFYVGEPFQICENSSQTRCQDLLDQDQDCGSAGGLMQEWSWAAPLECDKEAAHFIDWTTIDVVHLFHEGFVPDGIYDVQVVDGSCSLQEEGSYSTPLTMTQGKWGDICGPGPGGACTGVADGAADVAQDVLGLIDKFQNINALQKSMADLVPGDNGINNGPDFLVTIAGDTLFALDAFQGVPYPFTPGDPCGPG
ncbi:MAG: hypothetical protein V3W34_09350 [Phycisphaerae bacterium]